MLHQQCRDHWRRLAGVTTLHLESPDNSLVEGVLAALGSNLCSLQLCVDELPSAMVDSIAQLTQLTSLAIQACSWPALGPLTRLSCLKQLYLRDAGEPDEHAMQPGELADRFPSLERFSFEACYHMFQVRGALQRGMLPDGASWHAPLRLMLQNYRWEHARSAECCHAHPNPFRRLAAATCRSAACGKAGLSTAGQL